MSFFGNLLLWTMDREKRIKFIGVTGVARSGKDSISDALVSVINDYDPRFNVRRVAFADELKAELEPFFLEHFGVSSRALPNKDKHLYRPLLIAHGQVRRSLSDNKYWVEKLEESFRHNTPDIAIVSDLRYIIGKNSEYDWIKDNRGLVIHVKRYDLEPVKAFTSGEKPRKMCKIYVPPASNDEEANDPELESAADFNVDWETVGKEQIDTVAKAKAEEFFLKNINFFLR